MGSAIGIYCAKGGLRSSSVGFVLSMIGYRVFRLNGGYKAYRNHVLEFLERPLSTKFITLFGNTGCYKSKLIRALSPSIDLEAMANHLGSVFWRDKWHAAKPKSALKMRYLRSFLH